MMISIDFYYREAFKYSFLWLIRPLNGPYHRSFASSITVPSNHLCLLPFHNNIRILWRSHLWIARILSCRQGAWATRTCSTLRLLHGRTLFWVLCSLCMKWVEVAWINFWCFRDLWWLETPVIIVLMNSFLFPNNFYKN